MVYPQLCQFGRTGGHHPATLSGGDYNLSLWSCVEGQAGSDASEGHGFAFGWAREGWIYLDGGSRCETINHRLYSCCMCIFLGKFPRCLARQPPAKVWVAGVCVGWILVGLPPTGILFVLHAVFDFLLFTLYSFLREQRGLRPLRIRCK